MPEFPHLSDTTYPNIETVDVWRFRNTFNYTRWNVDTEIRLCNVLWNSDYNDVVKFTNDSARDAYFASLDSYSITLRQAARMIPDEYVKLPIPYDVAATFNYLYITLPIATSPEMPLDYENANGRRRWYFFIEDISYLAPNTTQFLLTLDNWTNYINDVEINYMMLERGHAPVSASDTDTYLANPLANNRYLLAPDVNYDTAEVSRHVDYVPFGNGVKYVCIASTCSLEQISELGTVTENHAYDPFNRNNLTYTDVNARYGHQLQVNGLTMGTGLDFSDARTPAAVVQTASKVLPNNLAIYAIPASECYLGGTFFADVKEQCPQFLNTVQACFVVDRECIEFQYPCEIAGHELWTCIGSKRNLFTKQLTQNDFNFPNELRRFAKLYTSPYSTLEVTDNDGTTFEIKIEETATVSLIGVVTVSFPYIDYKVYLDGIGGTGNTTYYWRDLAGTNNELQISNSDWFKYCFDWSIPTFALYMDGETAYQLSSFNRTVGMGLKNALVAYHNSMRSANTALENVIDSADTTLANVDASTDTAKTNAYNSAETAHTNAYNSAETGKENTYNSAITAYDNLDNSCNTRRENMDIAIAAYTDTEENGINTSTLITHDSNDLAYEIVRHGNAASFVETRIENQTTTATTGNSGVASMGSGAVGGVMGGAGLGAGLGAAVGSVIPVAGTAVGAGVGALAGAVIGFAGGAISAYVANANASIVTQAAQHVVDATVNNNTDNANSAANHADIKQQIDNINRRHCYQVQNDSNNAQTDNNNRNDRDNANRTLTTDEINADNTCDTAEANADNTRNTSETNADNNFATDRGNATRTHDTNIDNAGYTREVSEANAKEILENAANAGMASLLDARNAAPKPIGKTSGNPNADALRTRGVQMKVKTQSDSAIQQTGSQFARFGYALNQTWNVAQTGLCLMRNFTYWKASDIWVDDKRETNNLAQTAIDKIFRDGVTVWSDPTKIGRVSVYDN